MTRNVNGVSGTGKYVVPTSCLYSEALQLPQNRYLSIRRIEVKQIEKQCDAITVRRFIDSAQPCENQNKQCEVQSRLPYILYPFPLQMVNLFIFRYLFS